MKRAEHQLAAGAARSPRLRDPWLLLMAVGLGFLEGIDLIAVGYTLPRMSSDLALDSAQAGLVASTALFGLMIGAIVGGRAADLYGRRPIILVSILMMALGSIGTASAFSYQSLLIVRLVAGLGCGGLFPMLVTMAGEAARPSFRSTAIGIMMTSGPLAGIAAGLLALYPDWRLVFYIGGVGPLLFLPFIWRRVPSGGPAQELEASAAVRTSFLEALAGGQRLIGTLLIWSIAFCSTLVVYVFLNWLPSLLRAHGVGDVESNIALIVYSVGGIFGNLAGGAGVDRNQAVSADEPAFD
ncbi:3-hydroxyphenylpropionic acid transporter [Sphingobium indicum BiD32]|uniref:3-hydroxyphenylpropionic acid transporter n=1 Tax=Sphingobium indicum BiD32 TaxID=1301087 RepID=N1MQ52_9SPHN|nr:MFS transporter [Sphingobium indicum]CCW19061.1 3-hydroxyphenylpropionic acid transporter [Sphingobium indicum BiD32]